MRKIALLLVTTLWFHFPGYSQGGVDVIYVGIDTLDTNYIGKEVSIDFSPQNKHQGPPYLWRADTLVVALSNGQSEVREVRRRGVDYWYYQDQYFLIRNYRGKETLRVKKAELLRLEKDKVLFRLYLKDHLPPAQQITHPTDWVEDVWFPKAILDGVMMKQV